MAVSYYEVGQARWVILLAVSALSFVVPALLCLGVALAPAGSITDVIVAVVAAGVWMALLVLVNWWEFTSIWLRWIWPVVLAAAALRRLYALSDTSAALGPVGVGSAILAAAGTWLLARALAARHHSGAPIELSFPLNNGCFLVTDGGDGARSFLVNYHYGFGRHRRSGVNRSMRFAMDVVEIGPAGSEAYGFLPRHIEAYRVWEKPLHAPCDGLVVHTVNNVPDNPAFGRQRPYGVGNHVVIRKDSDVYVVLGHMRHGSVPVSPGDTVRTGAVIGRVGNSGWTERPHLHIQATRSLNADWWHADPLPMRFGGRFLVRNQMLRKSSATR